MTFLIAVYSPNAAWTLPRRFIESLKRDFPQHSFVDGWSDDDVARILPEVDAAFTASIRRGQIASLTRLKWIQSPAAGVGHLLSTELAESPIVLTSARGVRARAIAEHVLTVTLALARQIPAVVRRQAEHRWALDELEPVIRTVHRKRIGIVGLGSIGLEVARLASAVGLKVTAIRRRVEAGAPAFVESLLPPEALHDLLRASDVVVLSAPLTDRTRHLIDAAALSAIKRGSLLVNVGRGKLVDDEAVVEALRDGRLGGAALDVFTKEPLDPASPYWDLPNVIVTPHLSGAMEDYWTPLVDLFAENLRRFESGRPLLNVVDKAAGY